MSGIRLILLVFLHNCKMGIAKTLSMYYDKAQGWF